MINTGVITFNIRTKNKTVVFKLLRYLTDCLLTTAIPFDMNTLFAQSKVGSNSSKRSAVSCSNGSYYDEVSKVCVPEELCDVVTKNGVIIATGPCKLIQIKKES